MIKIKEKRKVHFSCNPQWTGRKDRFGHKIWGNDLHEFYIIEWQDTQKRNPVSAQKITYNEFWNSELPKEEIPLRGLGINTLNKVRKLAKENNK